MEIVWLGHSAVRLRSRGTTLITDPYGDSLGVKMPRQRADIVTVSHHHPHHSRTGAVDGRPRVLDGPGEFEVADYSISGMGTRRGSPDAPRQINTVYTIRVEDLTVCHLGDLNARLTPGQAQRINDADILFVPGGEGCTLGVEGVAELVNLVRPQSGRAGALPDPGPGRGARTPGTSAVGAGRHRGRGAAQPGRHGHQPAERAGGGRAPAAGLLTPYLTIRRAARPLSGLYAAWRTGSGPC